MAYVAPFLRYSEISVKITDLNLPLFGAPLGVTPSEFRRDFWRGKTRVSELSYGVVCVILCLTVSVEHRNVTDGQTDQRTHDDDKYRASIASRG